MGQYSKALPYYLEAIENTKKALGEKHLMYGTYILIGKRNDQRYTLN
jgi:hypothetical protein